MNAASSNSELDLPELRLLVKKAKQGEAEDVKAAQVLGLNPLKALTSSKIKNRSGKTVVIVQHEKCFGKPELRSLTAAAGASSAGASVGVHMELQPSQIPDQNHTSLLEDGKYTWLYNDHGKNVTIFPHKHINQFHAINQPLPGLMGRVIVAGECIEL